MFLVLKNMGDWSEDIAAFMSAYMVNQRCRRVSLRRRLVNPKGQTWVNFKDDCMELVAELMRINRNKRKYYQRGLRAMKLIESTF
jgi:hypothetical protein